MSQPAVVDPQLLSVGSPEERIVFWLMTNEIAQILRDLKSFDSRGFIFLFRELAMSAEMESTASNLYRNDGRGRRNQRTPANANEQQRTTADRGALTFVDALPNLWRHHSASRLRLVD
jgi:hypothetical protein